MKQPTLPITWRLRAGEKRIILILGDVIVLGLALLISLYIWALADAWIPFSKEFLTTRPAFWYWSMPLIWILLMSGLYDLRRANRRADTLRGIATAALISAGLYLLVYFTSEPNSLPRRGVATFIVTATLLTITWRLLYINIFTAPQLLRRVLVIGAGKAGTTLLKVIKETWPPPFYLIGLIDDDPQKNGTDVMGYPVLGDNQKLLQIVKEQHITDLILAISGEISGSMFQSILDASEADVEVTTMPLVYEEILGRVPIFMLEADWLIRSFINQARTSTFFELSKRLIDIIGSLFGLVFLIILSPFIAIAILLDSGFPIFFLQNRLGKSGHVYKIIKFRTMVQNAEKDGIRVTSEHDERITRVGWVLRKTHIDEFPQFINVLRGEMSLVGPRAERSELVQHLQENIPFYRARLLVKPGITGWAQVNFGYAVTVEDTAVKLEYDLYYIKRRSIWMDFLIMLRTISNVIGFRGQ
jgi:exopolysaccharide biosynthesis polyprenyl glycosylphosphotransferase